MENNNWARCTKKYCVDWIIKVSGIDNDYYNEYIFNPEGKKVLISFQSKSLGDKLTRIPYVEKFQQERKSNIVAVKHIIIYLKNNILILNLLNQVK